MNPSHSRRPSTTTPLLPSAFPNDSSSAVGPRIPSSRTSSARQSPALRDDLPLHPSVESSAAAAHPAVPYIAASSQQRELLAPSAHLPFFAIVEDARTGEVAHPSVHYVFSDDDPDAVAAASLRSLGADDAAAGLSPRVSRSQVPEGEAAAPQQQQQLYGRDAALPPARPGVEERYVLLDLAEDGHTVRAARSLSKEWAVTGTSVRAAPTFDDPGGDGGNGGAGLMLKVEGMGVGRRARAEQEEHGLRAQRLLDERRRAAGGDTVAAMLQVVEGLRKSMDALGKVVGNGDGQGSREEE